MTYNFILSACQKISRPHALRLLCIALGVLIAWEILSGVMSIFAIKQSLTHTERLPSIVSTGANPAITNPGLTALFFGKYAPMMINVDDVKKSLLTYKVVGIMLAEHDEDSEVIIDTLSGGDQIYRVGDALPWGTVIKRITSEGIFVERNGELESLSLPKNELIFEAPAKPLGSLP